MENPQVDKFNKISCFTQRRTNGFANTLFDPNLCRKKTVSCLTFVENTRQPKIDRLCLFRVLALLLNRNQNLEGKTSKMFGLFFNRMVGLSFPQFQGLHRNDIPIVEDFVHPKVFHHEINNVDGKIVSELARKGVQKYEGAVRMLRYNIHICYVSNVNAVFQSFSCPNCDTFFQKNIQFGATFNYMQ